MTKIHLFSRLVPVIFGGSLLVVSAAMGQGGPGGPGPGVPGPGGPPTGGNTDPKVMAVGPAYNASAAALGSDVQFFFRKPVVLTGGSPLMVRGAQSGGRSGTVIGSGTRQVRFNPTQSWLPGEEVTVVYRSLPGTVDHAVPLSEITQPITYRFRAATASAAGPLTAQAAPIATGISARQVEVADLDNDGDMDIVLVGTASGIGQVQVLQRGATGYTLLTTLVVSVDANIALGDVNNDGLTDLAVSDADAFTALVKIYRNPGTGVFTTGTGLSSQVTFGPGARGMRLVDLDFDGFLDLVAVNSNGSMSERLNDGTGLMNASNGSNIITRIADVQTVLPYSTVNGEYDRFLVGTLGQVNMYKTNGVGDPSGISMTINSTNVPVVDLAAGDFTGDSLADVVMVTTDGVKVATQQRNGSYSVVTLLSNTFVPMAKPGDLDGDGDLDIVVPFLNGVLVFRNDGSGSFTQEPLIPVNAPNSMPNALALADLNGDGTLDIVTANELTTNSASVLLNSAPNGSRSAVVNTVRQLSGDYDDVTVTGSGTLILGADLTITGTLTVQNGGTLRPAGYRLQGAGAVVVQAGATVEVYSADGLRTTGAFGDVQNTGARSFSPGARYVYKGTEAQQTGPGLTSTVLDLVVDNPQGVTLTNPTSITRAVVLTNGNLISNGRLTLLGTATGTALVVNTLGAVVGNATMQRYSSSALTGYRHVSAPVSNTTFADLATPGFTPRVQPLYNTNPAAVPAASYPNIFSYNETRLTGTGATAAFGQGYMSPTALTDPMAVGKGYTVYLPPTAKPDFVGTLNTDTISSGPLTRGSLTESGWHLLGNPYPSPLDWDVIASSFPGAISREVFVFRPTGGSSGTYVSRLNGVSTTDPNGVLVGGWIGAMQGFFVRVNTPGTTSFKFTNTARQTSLLSTAAYRTAAIPQVHLSLTAAADPAQTDYAAVYCAADATLGFDAQLDAAKQRSVGTAPSVFTRPVGALDELAINGIGLLTGGADVVLPIGLVIPVGGTYSLGATAADLPAGYRVFLDDALTGTSHELTNAPYALTLPVGEVAPGRLHLRLTTGGVLGLSAQQAAQNLAQNLALSPNPAHGAVVVSLSEKSTENSTATLLDVRGAVVRTVRFGAGASSVSVPLTDLAPGVYVVRVGSRTKRLVVQ